MNALDKIQMDNTFDTKHRSAATGLLSSINNCIFSMRSL